tara:strand:+ start:954 stop:1265 length:312 start_codon:yes stop_codon:yes gene_type:complete
LTIEDHIPGIMIIEAICPSALISQHHCPLAISLAAYVPALAHIRVSNPPLRAMAATFWFWRIGVTEAIAPLVEMPLCGADPTILLTSNSSPMTKSIYPTHGTG